MYYIHIVFLNMEYKIMQQRHFQQMWRRDVHVTTPKILLLLFWISTSYLSQSDYLVLFLNFYTVPIFSHAVRNFVNKKTVSCKQVSIFYRENMTSITAHLRLGPFLRGAAKLWIYCIILCYIVRYIRSTDRNPLDNKYDSQYKPIIENK